MKLIGEVIFHPGQITHLTDDIPVCDDFASSLYQLLEMGTEVRIIRCLGVGANMRARYQIETTGLIPKQAIVRHDELDWRDIVEEWKSGKRKHS